MYLETLRSRIDTHAKDTTVHVTSDEKSLWNSLASLFELVDIGTDESPLMVIRAKYGLFSDSFVSVRGSDPGAGQGGIGGLDIDAMWDALAESGTQKINASHIPLLQQLSGTLTNAQLANSSLSVAGVSVPLGGSVSTEQIAGALTEAGYKLTDTVTTLASLGITASAAELNFVDGVTSNIQTQLDGKLSSGLGISTFGVNGTNLVGWTYNGATRSTVTQAQMRTMLGLGSNAYTSTAYLPLAGGTMTGDIGIPASRATIDGSVPYAGSEAGVSDITDVENMKTCLGSYYDSSGSWWNLISIRHRNGNSDGNSYGMYLRAKLTAAGDLFWNRQKMGRWETERAIIDSANYPNYLDSRYLLKSSYTAADVLAKLKTVDGSGSGLDADLLDGLHASNFYTNGYTMFQRVVDASGLDQNTWYPVTFSIGSHYNVRIECRVSLNSGTKPSWSTHSSGFSVRKIWEVNGSGWGMNPVNRRILVSDYQYASSDPVRGIGQNTNSSIEYVYVRGGGKYYFYVSHNVDATLRTSSYTNNGVTISVLTSTPAAISRNVAYVTDNVASATKLATARLLWGRSFDGSGDISGNIIVGDAIIRGSVTSNNTRFISSDNASNIYFSVGGLVDLVAEPSCLRRGASNTSETLGTSTYRWANVYAVNGDYSGNLAVSGWINGGLNISTFGSNSDNSDTTRFLTYGHRVEFGGPGYAHVNYYLRPRYGASGETHADLFIQNASAAANPVFSTTHAFYNNGNAYHYGNLGLGTAAPQAKLDVNGNIKAVGITMNGQLLNSNGNITCGDFRVNYGQVELYGSTPFIDFHYGSSTADYTSRLIEGVSGQLTITGNLQIGGSYSTASGYRFSVNGTSNFTNLVRAVAGVQIGSTSDIGWYLNSGRIVAGQSVARGVNVGSLLVSGAWADYTKVPTNGIYSKGDIYSMGAISCRGADSQAADASSGIDSNALWNVLGAVGTEKINASHLPDSSKTLTCSTAAGTAAKVVTCTGFQLTTGAAVTVRFTSGNSAASPTLNVNGTGAKGIRVYRGTSLVTPFANWNANVTVELTYNGTYWVITGNPVVYSLNAASASDSSGTYYRTARIFADGWKEYAFVTNASGNDRTLAMPYAFSSVNSMGVVVTLFGTAPGAGNVKSKSTSSVTVDFSTSTASTSKRGTVLCFGY